MTSAASLSDALGDRYTIERELGRGGMATVYLARDLKHARDVAIKVLRPELGAVLGAERFLAEIKVTANLRHPNLLPLFDSGEADGLLFYVMPCIEGPTLRARLKAEPQLPVDEVIRIVGLLAGALDYAHAAGVVHRDLKPENILLQAGQPMIADFGIALAVVEAGGDRITQTGLSLGTPLYMSPEQASGERAVDARSDQYALGAITYEMLTGEPPHTGATAQVIIARLMTEAARPVRNARPGVQASVDAAVLRALSKSPADRFASGGEFVRAMSAQAMPVAVTSPVATTVAPVHTRSPSAPVIALVLGVLVIGFVGALVMRGRANGMKAATVENTTSTDRSIAVLPLANLSGDKADDYFGIGVAEEITRALTQTGVKVIGRVSAGALQARGLDERAIAKELGVASLLTGSIQRAAGQVRINVSLTSAADGAVRWTEKYDRPITNVFAVQDEIAKAVATKLLGTLGAGATRARIETADPEAYALFLQGQVLFNRRGGAAMLQAASLFARAAARDTTFARAHAMRALVQTSLSYYTDLSADSAQRLVEVSARRALALDPNSAEAYTALAHGSFTMSRNREADSLYRRSLALDSTVATTWGWYGQLAGRLGDDAAYRARVMRARALEPASLIARTWESDVLQRERRYAEADSQIQQTIALDSTFANGWRNWALILGSGGRFDEASALLERHRVDDELLAYLYARAGKLAKARAMLAVAPRRSDGKPRNLGMRAAVHEALGDHEAALELLERAAATHDQSLVQSTRLVAYDVFRKDPRGAAILAKIEAW